MRQYTQSATIGGDIVMADDWNDEIGTIVAEINGQLDANQMPLERVTDTKLKPATYEERHSSVICPGLIQDKSPLILDGVANF